ncbi:MAG: MOSC domain-containing protein [Planctomycetota bacterium]
MGARRRSTCFDVRLRQPAAGWGAFGENLLIEGLDFEALAPGMRLAVGEELLLEIADVREPCKTLKQVDGRFPALMEGRSGFLCRVLRTGWVQPGQGVHPIS